MMRSKVVFPGATFAEQGKKFSGGNLQGNIFQDLAASKTVWRRRALPAELRRRNVPARLHGELEAARH